MSDPAPPHAPSPAPPARASRAAWLTLLFVTALALALDLASKHLAFARIADAPVILDREEILSLSRVDPRLIGRVLPRHEPVVVVPRVLELTLVLNPGAVFGMGAGQRWFFMVFTGVAGAFALYMFAFWCTARDRSAHVAIGLLLAGGLGNFYDRMTFGCVRDFLHPLPGLTYPFNWQPFGSPEVWPYVSNVADAFLLIGIGILAVKLWRGEHTPEPADGAHRSASGTSA
ncbi:MAG: signal peptidase II [Phycisphaerae bacterium]|nr:signal peptidase II [Phycisphaerae bacterium]